MGGGVQETISRGYWISRNCQREAAATLEMHKPWVLVHESNIQHGGLPWADQLKEVPTHLRQLVDAPRHDVVPWLRLSRFQHESLKQIAYALLLAAPRYKKHLAASALAASAPAAAAVRDARTTTRADSQASSSIIVHRESVAPSLALTTSNERKVGGARLATPAQLYVSKANPGAQAVAQLLAAYVANLELNLNKPSHPAGTSSRASTRSAYSRRATQRLVRVAARSPRCEARRKDEPPASTVGNAAFWPRVVAFLPHSLKRRAAPPNATAGSHRSSGESASEGGDDFFFLLLNVQTFVGSNGDELANEVRALLARGSQPILVHDQRQPGVRLPEGDARQPDALHVDDPNGVVGPPCEFDRFLHVTPYDLVSSGLYSSLATPLHAGAFETISLSIIAEQLHAVEEGHTPSRPSMWHRHGTERHWGGSLKSSKPSTKEGAVSVTMSVREVVEEAHEEQSVERV